MKRISIITPCLNSEKLIGETISSVLEQTAVLSKRVELQYIICDGKSTDNTLNIIQSFNSRSIEVISEKDSSMYEALAKGLKKADGDIIAYLNAGDYYHKCAFDIVLDIFQEKKVKWLTGYNITYNDKSYVVGFSLPFKYRKNLILCGAYGKTLPFIQQESVFWHASLNNYLNLDRLSQFKYAGDYYIWYQFAQYETLNIVAAYLGGFKIMKGQLSESIEKYFLEVSEFVHKMNAYDKILCYFDKLIWYCPPKIKKILNKNHLFIYDHKKRQFI